MWNLKCTIIPVIIGATGIVTRSLRKTLEAIPGKHSIDSLQKTAILGTSHIIREVLQCEILSLSGGVHHWFKRSTRKKRPVTRDIYIIIIIIIIIIMKSELNARNKITATGALAVPVLRYSFGIINWRIDEKKTN